MDKIKEEEFKYIKFIRLRSDKELYGLVRDIWKHEEQNFNISDRLAEFRDRIREELPLTAYLAKHLAITSIKDEVINRWMRDIDTGGAIKGPNIKSW